MDAKEDRHGSPAPPRGRGDHERPIANSPLSSVPLFSVVVPTRNRPDRLDACLSALAALRYPGSRFEVVIVDDGSDSPVDRIVARHDGRRSVRLVSQPKAGPAAARNRGARESTGEFLAFTDDDCAPEPGWLEAFAGLLAAHPRCGFGGRTVNELPGNPYAVAGQLLIDYLYRTYNETVGRVPLYTSNNLVLPRDLFLAIGGFDEGFHRAGGEDRELCARWTAAGHRLEHASAAVVLHRHDLDLKGFLRQQFNYGRGAHRFHARSSGGLRPERPAFYLDLLRRPFAAGCDRRLRLSMLLAASQVANAAGFVIESARNRRSR